jgi:hypothetical protein
MKIFLFAEGEGDGDADIDEETEDDVPEYDDDGDDGDDGVTPLPIDDVPLLGELLCTLNLSYISFDA